MSSLIPVWTTVGLPNSQALLSSAPCSVHKALPQLVIQGAAAVAEVQGIPSALSPEGTSLGGDCQTLVVTGQRLGETVRLSVQQGFHQMSELG